MKCKDCTDTICGYRTSDGEKQCVFDHFIESKDENINSIDVVYDKDRLKAAIAFGQTLIALPHLMYKTPEDIAELAIKYADTLLNKLKK